MYCPKCGKENDDGAQFCGSCGNKLGASPEVKQASEASTTSTGSVTAGDGSTAAAAHKTGRILVIIGVVVVLALAIAAFATGGFGLMGVQPKSTVDVEASSQGGNDGQITTDIQGEERSVKSGVDAYSWEELSRISSEIASAADEAGAIEIAKKYNLCTADGKLDGTQVKFVTLSDGTQATVQIAGFAHDDKTDGGKAGITFIFKDFIGRHKMNFDDTNIGGWERSEMRSWLSSNVLGTLPEDLRNKIVAVDKLTNNTGWTTDISSVTTTSDRLWLFSATELCGTIDWSYGSEDDEILNAEGTEYKLFRDLNVDSTGSNAILTKTETFESESFGWWERSSESNNSLFFHSVVFNGKPHNESEADLMLGVVPGFCI